MQGISGGITGTGYMVLKNSTVREEGMKLGKWKIFFECGWYRGDAPAVLLIRFGEIVEDYPDGWAMITIVGIQIVKFSIGFGLAT